MGIVTGLLYCVVAVLSLVFYVLAFIIACRLPGYMTRQEARVEVIAEAIKLLSKQLEEARGNLSRLAGRG